MADIERLFGLCLSDLRNTMLIIRMIIINIVEKGSTWILPFSDNCNVEGDENDDH